MITVELLKKIYPQITSPERFVVDLNTCFVKYDISTPSRQAMFLAQCLHESGGFRYTKEIWGPTIWQTKYEAHKGLGNTQPGDGKKFMGRGLIQVTGRYNYTKLSAWIGDPEIITKPELLETKYAVLSAVWFWTTNKLNKFADANNIEACTKAVNGPGMLGLAERTRYYLTAKALLTAT
jgi:putative chitinase